MVEHHIIMSSSYVDGVRIALDFHGDTTKNRMEIAKAICEIKATCGDDVSLSTHFLTTELSEWSSVREFDPFFEDVKLIGSVADFVSCIQKSRVLTGLDVATYILTKTRCTHLSLEKLVYFAYAEYLCSRSKRLFEDKIFAFTHGPVVESVYDAYKRSGYKYLEPYASEGDTKVETKVQRMAARSRILFAEDGINKLKSIDATLGEYGKLTAGTLVSLTHRAGSPWSMTDSSKAYQLITDELIREHHDVERIR